MTNAEQEKKLFTVTKIDKFVVCDPDYHRVGRGKIGFFDVVLPSEFKDYEIDRIRFKQNPRLAAKKERIDERKWLIESNNERKKGENEPFEKVRFIVVVRNTKSNEEVQSADPIIVND